MDEAQLMERRLLQHFGKAGVRMEMSGLVHYVMGNASNAYLPGATVFVLASTRNFREPL